jgi:hypothetical protein
MTTDDNKPMATGSWRYTPAGIPIPGWTADLLDEDYFFAPNRWKRFTDRAFQLRKRHWHLIGMALEVEHRRRPITRLYLLRDALNRIRQPGYDLGPARALGDDFQRACWAKMLANVPDQLREEKRETELERAVKALPASPAENLVLMRAALRMPARERS